MDFLGLSLRMCDNSGDVYLPYSFEGNWSSKEEEIITSVISQYVPERVDSMFNNWVFIKYDSTNFWMKRATWEQLVCKNSAEELAQRLLEYYSR